MRSLILFLFKIEELKPGGRNIPVTADNRIEYIHLMADYKLNKQVCHFDPISCDNLAE